jgi:protein-S-isoprenylcysteine O-methyltransferase Ste14
MEKDKARLKYYKLSSFYIPIIFVVSLILALLLFKVFPRRLFDSSLVAMIVGLFFLAWGTIMVIWTEFSHHNLSELFSGTLTATDLSRGVYRYSRHPGTIGFLLMFFGFGFFVNSITIVLFAWLISSLLSWFVIPVVERHMKVFCGDEYGKYCQNVRMWL